MNDRLVLRRSIRAIDGDRWGWGLLRIIRIDRLEEEVNVGVVLDPDINQTSPVFVVLDGIAPIPVAEQQDETVARELLLGPDLLLEIRHRAVAGHIGGEQDSGQNLHHHPHFSMSKLEEPAPDRPFLWA